VLLLVRAAVLLVLLVLLLLRRRRLRRRGSRASFGDSSPASRKYEKADAAHRGRTFFSGPGSVGATASWDRPKFNNSVS
jgi:hypothetical protein